MKKAEQFSPAEHTPTFHLGKKYISRRGGGNMHSKFNIPMDIHLVFS